MTAASTARASATSMPTAAAPAMTSTCGVDVAAKGVGAEAVGGDDESAAAAAEVDDHVAGADPQATQEAPRAADKDLELRE